MRRLGLLLLTLCLAACASPEPKAYETGPATDPAHAVLLGKNTVGEDCTQQAVTGGVDIYCGTWQQPSARVRRGGGTADVNALTTLATASPWRAAIDERLACAGPQATTILSGAPAVLLQCTRRNGGWPQLAMVASTGGEVWFADGVLPSLPPMERAIGLLSGQLRSDSAPVLSGADALLASRTAARAFSSGDIGQFQTLIRLGTRANRAEDPVAAEQAFRAALALQEKALGADNPNTVMVVTTLGLQISNQGRFHEADIYFDRAARLAPRSDDRLAAARLAHYRALHLINQNKPADALKLLDEAEADYAALVPQDVLMAQPRPKLRPTTYGVATVLSADSVARQPVVSPDEQNAMLGIIETRRNRAVVERLLNHTEASERAAASAERFARANGLDQPGVVANVYRTAGLAAAAAGRLDDAEASLADSTRDFATALPGARPIAETRLRRAGLLLSAGQPREALAQCRDAIALLRELAEGVNGDLLVPCLSVYADQAAQPGAARQPILAEMFIAAQLGRGSTTSRQIEQAAVRLAETARDPRVGAAIRQKEDVRSKLADLQAQRDALTQSRADPAARDQAAALDKQLAETRAALGEADSALQAASPNYGQLVQQVVTAADVFAALRPGEAFALFELSDADGWTFLLRDGAMTVARIPGGTPRMAALVTRVRAGIERTGPGLPRFDTDAAHDLYDATLGGVAGALTGASTLTVAPSGPLLSLPFPVLLTGPGDPARLTDAPFLIRQLTIAHVPAAANFVGLRKIAGLSHAQRGWFGFGDFRPVTLAQARRTFPPASCGDSAQLFAGLPPLPNARTELEVARQLTGAGPGDQLLGPAFTEPAVVAHNLQDYRVLHFATHALLPTDLACQSEPAIVTSAPAGAPDASGALLTASEVSGMKLDADAIILSACNTGGGDAGAAGESLSGLARAFFYAGARALLVTHWSVDDRSAAYLVGTTLANLRKSPELGLSAALRTAQLSLLDDAGKGVPAEIAHPFFWAPFAVIGDGGGSPAGTGRT